jgi:uncharacterized protein
MPPCSRDSLHGAASSGNLNELKKRIEQNGDIEELKGMAAQTALLMACSHDQLDSAKILLEAGANVHAQTSRNSPGLKAMHYAAGNGNTALMKLLLMHGAEIDAISDTGGTPLHSAAYYGKLAAVKWLVANGADISIKNRQKQPKAARQLAQANKHAEVTSYLKEVEDAGKVKGKNGAKRTAGSSSTQPAKKSKVGK